MEFVSTSSLINTKTISELEYIRNIIEGMNKFNQIEVLRILYKSSSLLLNENKNGIHINLSEVNQETLNELNDYIKYVNTQEINLKQHEMKKEVFKTKFFEN
jgi:hypothetical protein